jgi:hypothetical protein
MRVNKYRRFKIKSFGKRPMVRNLLPIYKRLKTYTSAYIWDSKRYCSLVPDVYQNLVASKQCCQPALLLQHRLVSLARDRLGHIFDSYSLTYEYLCEALLKEKHKRHSFPLRDGFERLTSILVFIFHVNQK